MPGRSIPEPPPPDDDPERLAEERELARSARLAGLAVQRTTDLARLIGGKPDHYTRTAACPPEGVALPTA